eukprot:gnl/TRDRNA2_/TRDRNA2_80433_c0_seq1.p1 gnl/TRDRNA2_/TRDRNA2_80433_c0~~gnl/TRDRNA2_/TRDRNA2_80433_c0_seq1.p1  ORF type:complete len:333 (+),score=55.01 gnl/TRDRNA2_/TRDRNA2_80433_c0_seq1:109-1107(+)
MTSLNDKELSVLLRVNTVGAAAVCALTTPLDVARHSVQAALAKKAPARSMREALRAAAQPNALGLWRGFFPALGLAALSPAPFLLVYELYKDGEEVVWAGCVARAVQTTLLQPLEFMRTCRQARALLPSTSGVHLDRGMWEVCVYDGFFSLWRGLWPALLRDVSASAVFWSSYIGLQRAVVGSSEAGQAERGPIPALWNCGFGAVSAAFAAAVTQPFDIVKTKIQVHELAFTSKTTGYKTVKKANVLPTCKEVYNMAGITGFWTGCLPRVLRFASAGVLLGPVCEFAELIADDAGRPRRQMLQLPEDPSNTIVHPRASDPSRGIDLARGQPR